MDKMLTIIAWDEINGEAQVTPYDDEGPEQTATDDELVIFARTANNDKEDPDMPWGKDWLGRENTWGWRAAAVTRGTNTATIEWRSDRNHHAVTMFIWT